jgi:protein O-GlcNAc transferase
MVAEDREAYLARAVELAGDLPRLAEMRAGLREKVLASPLCDGRRLARQLERAYRMAWAGWCGAIKGDTPIPFGTPFDCN